MNNVEIKITNVSSSGRVDVMINNPHNFPIKIWKESNSWGAARWRVLVLRRGTVETFFGNPDQVFTRNIPAFNEIEGPAQLKQGLDLNGGNWCWRSQCSMYNEKGIGGQEISFEADDVIVVIYDVPRTVEAVKMGVWYGVAATSAKFTAK
jgi:hypothetical protein